MLQRFNQEIDARRVSGTKLGISGVDSTCRRLYRELYRWRKLQDETSEIIRLWSDDVTSAVTREHLSASLQSLRHARPYSNQALLLACVCVTRKARWSRLVTRVGLRGVPDFFVVYRVLTGVGVVKFVAERWADDRRESFPVQGAGLASWSLMKGDRSSGAMGFLSRDFAGNGVVYRTVVPFRSTFFDKWVDDSTFLSKYPLECEIVVGSWSDRPIICAKSDVEVHWDGRVYGYAEHLELETALRRDGVA